MIKIKVNGKPKEIPTCYEELKFSTFCNMAGAKNNPLAILSIILEMPESELKGARLQGLDIILKSMDFMKKEPILDEYPTKLGRFTIPKDIGAEFIEQYEDVKAEFKRVSATEDIKTINEAMAFYAAVYCQGTEDVYDHDKAKELSKEIMNYPCVEVMSVGSFFLAKSLNMTDGLSMNFLRRNFLLRKKRPVLNRLMRRLGFPLRWTT
mgnify:CR=1 FL=1